MTTININPINPLLNMIPTGGNFTLMGQQPGRSVLPSGLWRFLTQNGLSMTQKEFETAPNLLAYYLKSELTMFDMNEALISSIRDDDRVMKWMDEVDDVKYEQIPVEKIKIKKTLTLEKFLKTREREIAKTYKKYLKNIYKQKDNGFNPLEHRLKIESGLMRAKLPINITQTYLIEYLKLDSMQVDLQKEFAINKFFRKFKTHIEVEKYLNFIKKEYSDVDTADIKIDQVQLSQMKKIVLEGLKNEIEILEKYYLKLKLSSKMHASYKEKVKKI